MTKLFFASLLTLTVLSSFVFFIIILALLYTEAINIGFAVGFTITINFILWLIGPTITDLFNSWFYKVRFLSEEEVGKSYPEVAQLIDQVATEYGFPFPKVGIIPDGNPTAFTYGSARYNARIILTEGIFKFLNTQQTRAVVAHELGHIVNRDFIVMMVGSTLVQILYEIYAILIRSRGRKSGGAKLVALLSYVLYIISVYILYYLSRTREYLADEFSSKVTAPKDLADALVKIAYGIVVVEDSDASKRLLQSTRHLGIIDVKNAKHIGVVTRSTNADPDIVAEVMVFDKVSPWAKLIELSSTHPLTGNRLDRLSDLSKLQGQPFSFDIDAAIERLHVDRARLYSGFWIGLLIFFLPWLLGVTALFLLPLALLPGAVGLGLLLQVAYKYPRGDPEDTTILEQMRDPYASPIRGKPVALSGEVIGRGIPGYIFGEDMMYRDPTGIVFLDYTSAFGFIGNIFFALKKLRTLFGVRSRAVGWFYRNIGSFVSLRYIERKGEVVQSHPILWAVLVSLLLIALSLFLFVTWPSTPSLLGLFDTALGG